MITLLIGHRGTGKTSLLKRLEVIFSNQEDAVFKDLDDEIEVMHRRSVVSIFANQGEAEFRKFEAITFKKLLEEFSSRSRVYIAVGAGFEFEIPSGVRVIWLRRPTDVSGRIFLNRPKLSLSTPLGEWKSRFTVRDPHYRAIAHEELMLPEGGLHDKILEDHFFTERVRAIPYSLTVLPENFRSMDFFERRRNWGLKSLEARDDLLDPGQIEKLKSLWPSDQLVYSVRKNRISARPGGVSAVDWPLEFGEPPFPPEILSLHQRDEDFQATLAKVSRYFQSVIKLAVEVRGFEELLAGHRWWLEKPEKRAFLPRSEDGRWQWYRQLFGPKMPLHFFREGDGTSLDQPYLWQTLIHNSWQNGFAAVLGSPVVQSWTPAFQREFFVQYGIPVVATRVTEAEWEAALPVLRTLGLRFASVTSPLKKKAFAAAVQWTKPAEKFASVNTLAWTENAWAGDNTDHYGAELLLKDLLSSKIPTIVWGGGGTKEILKSLLPKAEFVPARIGKKLTAPVRLVWAVGCGREFAWPEPASFIQSITDLNYSEDSPGREIAQRADCSYKSGETMFIHQGLKQREFWMRFL